MDQISLSYFIYLGIFIVLSLSSFIIYQKNKKGLATYKSLRKIQPDIIRYIFSSLIYASCFFAPAALVTWIIDQNITFLSMLLMFLTFYIIYAPSSYQYYTLIIDDQRIIGANLSGWRWGRNEINFHEIDIKKVLKQKLGKILGIVVFHSTKKVRIQTIGLDNTQISEILKLSSKDGNF